MASASELALERQFPGLRGRLPRLVCTTLPTRVHRLDRLARAVGLAEVWVKRDDESGTIYGGNKPRKLEFILGDVLRRRRRAVLTFGGIGTHHGLATALVGARAGLQTHIVLLPQPVTAHVQRTLLASAATGATLHYAANARQAAAAALRVVVAGALRGAVPVLVPPGGSSVLGALGYVNAAFELDAQITGGLVPEPDVVFVALGTGGTAAGLCLGLALAGRQTRVVGVLVVDMLAPTPRTIERLARRTLRVLQRQDPTMPRRVSLLPVRVVRDFRGARYGAPTTEGIDACDLMAFHERIPLETTYTAKCLAALLVLGRTPEYRGRRLLFWNTFSAVDPAAMLTLPDPATLPPAFQRFFDGASASTAARIVSGSGRLR